MISTGTISLGTNGTAKLSSRRTPWSNARAALLGLAACALSSPALASPSYPGIILEELDLGCVPQCTICHTDNYGGNQTAEQPFALTLQSATTFAGSGVSIVSGGDDDGLKEAIAYLASLESGAVAGKQGIDSDADGVDDIAELTQLRDPSVPGVGDMCGPRYGCGAHVEPRGTVDLPSALALGLCALGLGVVARRRSKERALTPR